MVKYNLRGAPMNNEDMIPNSSPSSEDRQPTEVEEPKNLDAESFWRAYPLILGKSQITVVT